MCPCTRHLTPATESIIQSTSPGQPANMSCQWCLGSRTDNLEIRELFQTSPLQTIESTRRGLFQIFYSPFWTSSNVAYMSDHDLVPPHTAATEPLSDIQSNSVNFIDWVWKRSRTIIRFSLCLAVKCAEVFQRELVQFIDMGTGIKLFFDDYLLMSVQIDIKMTLD